MSAGRRFLHAVPILALATACTGIGVLAATLFRPEAVLDRSIGIALGGTAPNREATVSSKPRIVDSPDFRLSRLDEGPLGLANPILVGDRIEISGRDGHSRSLEVTDIRELDSGFTHSENAASPRLLLVTCREVGGSGARVRFIIEADELTPPVRRPERTL